MGFNLNPATRKGAVLSPLSSQPGDASGVSLGAISLKGMPEERPRGGGKTLKTYSLLKFDAAALSGICGGVIGRGGRFCLRQAAACDYTSHQTKAWEARLMDAGMYILDGGAMKAFLEPCLPIEDATCSAT